MKTRASPPVAEEVYDVQKVAGNVGGEERLELMTVGESKGERE